MKRLKALLTIMMVFGFIMILSGAAKSDMDISEVSDSICDVFCGLICLISGFIMRLYLDAYILKKRRSVVRKVKNIRISSNALHGSQKGIRQARKPFVIPEIV